MRLDVRSEASIKKFVEEAINRFGKIDVLVNNAGVIAWKELEKQTPEEIEDQINTNLLGLIKTTKAFLPAFCREILRKLG